MRDGREQTVTVKLAERPRARHRGCARRRRRRSRAERAERSGRRAARPDRPRSRSSDRATGSSCRSETRGVLDHARRAAERVVRRRHRARHGPARDQPAARSTRSADYRRHRARRAPGRRPHPVPLRARSRAAPAQDGPRRRALTSPIPATCPNHAFWSSTTKRRSATR